MPQEALIAEIWVKRKDKWELVASSFVGQAIRGGAEEKIRADVSECYTHARLILKAQFPQWFQQNAGVRLHSAKLQVF